SICSNHNVDYAAYGHLGDGNMHVTIYIEKENPKWHEIIEGACLEVYELVKNLGGTLTGEHGVGLKRVKYIPFFLDEAQIDLIRRVKLAFDPNNILNPGKIVPWD
ncbi:MAG: FAD-binding oxidoreductase, partial [Synergistaceae bacterium]|nr:FAD-binding oxidoreductase [Synergistaceae bacterium]